MKCAHVASLALAFLSTILGTAVVLGQEPPTSGATVQPAPVMGAIPAPGGPATAPVPQGVGDCGQNCDWCPNYDGCSDCDCGSSLYWAQAEYLLWWLRRPSLPPLVTTSDPGVPAAFPAALGQPGTRVLFGGDDLRLNEFHGVRVLLGGWLSPDRELGAEVGFFYLPEQTVRFRAASDGTGNPTLGIPFQRSSAAGTFERVALVATPGVNFGNIGIDHDSQLWGLQANLLAALDTQDDFLPLLTIGFRYLDLDESLGITQNTFFLPGFGTILTDPVTGAKSLVVAPNGLSIQDSFDTRNQFYGGQLGARWRTNFSNWIVQADARLGLGVTHQTVNIQGQTSLVTANGVSTVVPGGFLAVGTNSGRFSSDEFTVVPEVHLKVAYQVGPRLSAFVGYDFLYWNQVVRPGDQIDRTVNTNQVPSSLNFGIAGGEARPVPRFETTDLWLQGLNFGVAVVF